MATLTGQVIGRYQILDRIGQGGMAAVYRAYDPVERRNVAVKVLSSLAAESPHFTARFAREARTVAQLRHPNIVPVWDYGEAAGKHFLVMPLLEVGSLSDRLRNGPIRPRESGRIVEQVSQALEYAHRQGVIHRDVKPSNILLDQDGNALVSDFGLVYIENASISLTGSALIGTPAYMSPEQASGDKVTPAADQYAFGVVLYELATGQLPYDGETPMAVAIKHITSPIPFPREQNPNVPEAIEHVILKATAKEPTDRFESMAALGEAYKAALEHVLDPSSNPPPRIDVPDSVLGSRESHQAPEDPEEKRRRRLILIPLTLAILLLFLLLPGRAFGLLRFLDGFSGEAEGTGLTVADLSGPQLTAMAGTLQVMSTQLAVAQGTSLSPEEMQTAVVESFLGTQESEDPGPGWFAGQKDSPTPTGAGTNAAPGTPRASPTPTAGSTSPGAPSATLPPTETSGALPATTSPPSTLPPATATLPGPLASPLPPTSTRTRTLAPSPTITPSITSTPSITLSPTPTATLTLDPCLVVGMSGGSVSGKDVEWNLENLGGMSVTITALWIDWPAQNQKLERVKLDGATIWDEKDDTPPSGIDSNWKGPSRTISAGGTRTLLFQFHVDAVPTGYNVDVTLDNGCVISADH